MAKVVLVLLAIAASLCIVGAMLPLPHFTIKGRVYCDTCRVGFVTTASEYIQGATVRLECKHYGNDEIKHKVEGFTNADGTYQLELEDDHQEEICEVALVNSSRTDCGEIPKAFPYRARVEMTRNNGMPSAVRFANPLGFLRAEPLMNCAEVLKQYHLFDDDF
ncbi:hypothetical protein LUZ60_011523 [Juncus effusus]|nr:hypothetical protein LUZ60_011523 [Juncus effusus]